jgi:hypothetical protein
MPAQGGTRDALRQQQTRPLLDTIQQAIEAAPRQAGLMRPVALGRKRWIHLGSQHAGPKGAAILSAVETCRRPRIPVRQYLAGCSDADYRSPML